MSQIANALGVSRPHLATTLRHPAKVRGRYTKADDEALLVRIRSIVDKRPTYGYRRVHALLNREAGQAAVNHKRVYRVMKQANLLLTKARQRPERPHDGKVVTLKSNLRWCTDMFEIRAWSGEKVYVAFAMDCCDREILSYVGEPRHLDGADVRDLMAKAVEARFDDIRTPHPVEWLSDNGPPYTASETRKFGRDTGLLVRTTPSYSPESNGMAEAFVKTFKRDYVYVNDVSDAASIIRSLESYFSDYNEHAPHKGLKMLSPRMFRRANLS